MERSPEYFCTILNELRKDNPELGKGFLLRETAGDPLDVLILTLLSQATNDRNSGRAFRRLKQRFPTWDRVLEASEAEIEEAIRVGGLARQKAARIKGILRAVLERTGSFSLEFLRDWDTDAVWEYLTSLEGVGPKTAACVALFSLGRPAFPVDTHILRVSKRLGLVDEKASAEKAQEHLQKTIPPEMSMDLHLGLIEHGRRTCRPSKPGCHECRLRTACRRPAVEDFTPPAENS
ncbi:MAG: endonuclease III [Firmicutes bacterium]|nr:endonuclease III [Bacillota bacterium]